MAQNIDTAKMKQAGFLILGLGAVMAGISFWTDQSWQLYAGIAGVVLGLGLAGFAFSKK